MGEKILICLLQKLSSSAAWPKYLINASWECGAGRRKQVAHLYLGLKKFSNEFSIFCVCIWDSKSSPKSSQYFVFVSRNQKVFNILCLYLGLKKLSKRFKQINTLIQIGLDQKYCLGIKKIFFEYQPLLRTNRISLAKKQFLVNSRG